MGTSSFCHYSRLHQRTVGLSGSPRQALASNPVPPGMENKGPSKSPVYNAQGQWTGQQPQAAAVPSGAGWASPVQQQPQQQQGYPAPQQAFAQPPQPPQQWASPQSAFQVQLQLWIAPPHSALEVSPVPSFGPKRRWNVNSMLLSSCHTPPNLPPPLSSLSGPPARPVRRHEPRVCRAGHAPGLWHA